MTRQPSNSDRILLFIPVFNCSNNIKNLLSKLEKKHTKFFKEIIIIDNASTDNTVEEIKKIKKKKNLIKIIINKKNYGLGGSHKIAFKYALKKKYDYCCVLHGDDQARVQDLIKVIKNQEYKGFFCLRGGRFKSGSKLYGYSKLRILGNLIFKIIYSLLLKKKIDDIGTPIAIYDVLQLKKIKFISFANDMSFDSFMLLIMDHYKLKYKFFKITFHQQDQISNTKLIATALKILYNIIIYKLNKNKFIKN